MWNMIRQFMSFLYSFVCWLVFHSLEATSALKETSIYCLPCTCALDESYCKLKFGIYFVVFDLNILTDVANILARITIVRIVSVSEIYPGYNI